ncbi:MAG: hypothetical protein JW966_04160 [Anaerolineae bacterium]|nr:hypothetical protein [Anaerolineae bacterium]
MSEYDPGDWYDNNQARRRRRRRHESEYDDAWAAAFEDDIPDDHVEVEDLAAGYTWDEPRRYDDGDPDSFLDADGDMVEPTMDVSDLGPLPSSYQRLANRRHGARSRLPQGRYDRSAAYPNSPSFHEKRKPRLERTIDRMAGGDPYMPALGKPKNNAAQMPGMFAHIPFWGIVLLVVLAFAACGATAFACISVLTLF